MAVEEKVAVECPVDINQKPFFTLNNQTKTAKLQ